MERICVWCKEVLQQQEPFLNCELCSTLFHLTCSVQDAIYRKKGNLEKQWLCSHCQQSVMDGDGMAALWEEIDRMDAKLQELEGKLIQLRDTQWEMNTNFTEQITELEDDIKDDKLDVDDKSVQIWGVSVTPGENVTGIVLKIAEKLGVKLAIGEITAHRQLDVVFVESRFKREVIIVRFAKKAKKIEMLSKRKNQVLTQRDLVPGGGRDKIYINDVLSPYYEQLLQNARQKAYRLGYKSVWWHKDCVCVRAFEYSDIIKIYTNEDLQYIVPVPFSPNPDAQLFMPAPLPHHRLAPALPLLPQHPHAPERPQGRGGLPIAERRTRMNTIFD